MSNPTARAIVYAVRQAQLINQYGMTWEAIETNIANIMAGCSVPADGKMTVNNMTPEFKWAVEQPMEVRLRDELSLAQREIRALTETWHDTRDELDKTKQRMENLQGMVSRQIASLQRIKDERDTARQERDTALIQMRAANYERDALLVDLNDMTTRRDEWSAISASETAKVEMLERDRDGFRRGAQFWMDSSKQRQEERDTAESKVEKLRKVLQDAIDNPFNASINLIRAILEETK